MMIIPKNTTSTLWLLSWATFLNRSTGFLALFSAIFFNSSGFDERKIIIALFLCGVAGVISSTIAGSLADRIGAKQILIGATVFNIPVTLGLAYANSPIVITLLAAASVCFSQAFIPPASAIIALSVSGPDRVSTFAFYRIFINVGSIVAPAIVGFIGTEHFHTLFLISTVGYVLTAALLAFSSPYTAKHSGQEEYKDQEDNDALRTFNSAASHATALWIIFIAMGIAMAIYAQHQGAVPLSMAQRPNGDRVFASLLILNPVLVICLEYPLSYLTKRIHWATALSLGTLIMGIGVAITGAFSPVVFAYVGWILFSLGECIFAPMSNTAVAELSAQETISRNQGILASFQSAGMALGPAVGTTLFFASANSLWLAITATSVTVAVAIALTRYKTTASS